MVPKRSSILVVCLAATLVLSGCVSGGSLDETQEKQVVEQFQNRMENLDGYKATVEATITFDNETRSTTMKLWARPGTGEMRQKTLAPAKRAGDLMVSNGSHIWYYDESENTVREMDVSGTTGSMTMGSRLDELVDKYDIVYNGTTSLDGNRVHKVTMVPTNNSDARMTGTITMWLDAERLFPRKMKMEGAGGTFTSTVRFTDVTLDPDFEAGTFTFEPPADATVEEPSADISTYSSRSELADATRLSVPDPAVPGGFSFESGSVTTRDGRTIVSQSYTDGDSRVMVVKQNTTDVPRPGNETVAVGDQTARFSKSGTFASLSWQCDGNTYVVMGNLDKSTLVDIAASVECA